MSADGTYNMDLLDNCFTELILEKKLILKEIDDVEGVFLSTFYYTELNIARMLLELNIETTEDGYIMGIKLDTIEKLTGVQLDELQRKAVIETQNNGVSVITGGPGKMCIRDRYCTYRQWWTLFGGNHRHYKNHKFRKCYEMCIRDRK